MAENFDSNNLSSDSDETPEGEDVVEDIVNCAVNQLGDEYLFFVVWRPPKRNRGGQADEEQPPRVEEDSTTWEPHRSVKHMVGDLKRKLNYFKDIVDKSRKDKAPLKLKPRNGRQSKILAVVPEVKTMVRPMKQNLETGTWTFIEDTNIWPPDDFLVNTTNKKTATSTSQAKKDSSTPRSRCGTSRGGVSKASLPTKAALPATINVSSECNDDPTYEEATTTTLTELLDTASNTDRAVSLEDGGSNLKPMRQWGVDLSRNKRRKLDQQSDPVTSSSNTSKKAASGGGGVTLPRLTRPPFATEDVSEEAPSSKRNLTQGGPMDQFLPGRTGSSVDKASSGVRSTDIVHLADMIERVHDPKRDLSWDTLRMGINVKKYYVQHVRPDPSGGKRNMGKAIVRFKDRETNEIVLTTTLDEVERNVTGDCCLCTYFKKHVSTRQPSTAAAAGTGKEQPRGPQGDHRPVAVPVPAGSNLTVASSSAHEEQKLDELESIMRESRQQS